MTSLAKDLEFWMTNLPKTLRSVPVTQLAIPGSHDSTTYALNKKSKISPDARKPVQYLKCLEPILQPTIMKWSKTQSIDVTEQLNSGIRYFDLRIAFRESYFGFFFVHNLYAVCVNEIFERIKEFLDAHPSEIVILDCQHFYNMSPDLHARFVSLLLLIFGLKLLPYSPSMAHISLDYMTYKCTQVILIYRADIARSEELLWPAESFPTPWPNTTSIPKLISFLNTGLKNRNYSLGFVSQCVLTPTFWFALVNLFSSLKNKCVLPLEKAKYDWLRQKSRAVNIVISDFVEYNDYEFPKEVINLNLKLLEA